MQCSRKGQDQSAVRYIASTHLCPNCHKIASIVRDWQAFTPRENRRSHQIGSWSNFRRAKECVTCQSLVRLFDSTLLFNAFVSISASYNRKNLSIHLYEEGADQEELSTKTYELNLLPSKGVNPHGDHYIGTDIQWVSIERICHWAEQCDSTHESSCNNSQLRNDERPTEVFFIDVQSNCLVKHHLNQRYVALSYVWGQQRNIFQTTLSNVNELMQVESLSKAWESVPATIQDAIILARRLNIRFLWVDRLCIVQDDEASVQSNIAQMASIYAQSYFTIIATEGDSETGILGIPGGSKPRLLPQELLMFDDLCFLVVHKDVYFGNESALTQDEDFRGSHELEVERQWHQRAWTFQERTVSIRCLVFNNDTVSWECGKGVWTELLGSPKISYEDSTIRNGKFANPHWRLERQSWPNATQYAEVCEGFSTRRLTYANDALKAFSAITQGFTPSFPGGFFYALPEFMFDLALLWTSVRSRHVRREMFPSWSWIAWEGYEGISLEPYIRDCWGPIFTNDELRIFRRPLNTWRKRNAVTGQMEVINNTYHVWLNAEQGRAGSLPGWKSSQQPENFTLQELGLSKGRVSHPVPIANNLSVQPLPSSTWEPFLYARVQTATFRFAGVPDHPWGTVGIMESSEKRVGNLRAHDSGGKHEPLGMTGRECCLMAVCEATIPRWSQFILDIHFSTGSSNYSANNLAYPRVTTGTPFKWVDVLWVEWKGQVAYRRGAGQVWMDAWERASPEEVDIILG